MIKKTKVKVKTLTQKEISELELFFNFKLKLDLFVKFLFCKPLYSGFFNNEYIDICNINGIYIMNCYSKTPFKILLNRINKSNKYIIIGFIKNKSIEFLSVNKLKKIKI